MRLNHSEVVVDFDGNPILGADDAPLTFRFFAEAALNAITPEDGAERKAKIFAIFRKLYQGKFVKLTVDEAALVKEQAGRALTPFAYGRLCDWLEGEPQFLGSDQDDDQDDPDPS